MIIKYNKFINESVRDLMKGKSDEDLLNMNVDAEQLLEYSLQNNFMKGIKFVLDNYKLYGKETRFMISHYMSKIENNDDLKYLINDPQIRRILSSDRLYVIEKYRLGLHKNEIREFEKVLIDHLNESEFFKSTINPDIMICKNTKEEIVYFNYYLNDSLSPNKVSENHKYDLIYHLDQFVKELKDDPTDRMSRSKYDIDEQLLVKGVIQDYFNININKCTGARDSKPTSQKTPNNFVWEKLENK